MLSLALANRYCNITIIHRNEIKRNKESQNH